jgi:hypothetical protein
MFLLTTIFREAYSNSLYKILNHLTIKVLTINIPIVKLFKVLYNELM